jgi:hypothetical protein
MRFSIIFTYFHHILDRHDLPINSKPWYSTFRWSRRVKLMNRARKSVWKLRKVREMAFAWPKKWVKKCTLFQACTLNAKNRVLGAVKFLHFIFYVPFFCVDSSVMTSYGPLSPRRVFASLVGREFESWDRPCEKVTFAMYYLYTLNLNICD